MNYKTYFYVTWLIALISISYALTFKGILADETSTSGEWPIGWFLVITLFILLTSRLFLDMKNKKPLSIKDKF